MQRERVKLPDGAELELITCQTLIIGQVGGLRAAQYIANVYDDSPMSRDEFLWACAPQIERELGSIGRFLNAASHAPTNAQVRKEVQRRMTRHGAFIRSLDGVSDALAEAHTQYRNTCDRSIRVESKDELNLAFQNEHLCLTHITFLETIRAYIERGGGSRGGYVIADPEGELVTGRGAPLKLDGTSMDTRAGSTWISAGSRPPESPSAPCPKTTPGTRPPGRPGARAKSSKNGSATKENETSNY